MEVRINIKEVHLRCTSIRDEYLRHMIAKIPIFDRSLILYNFYFTFDQHSYFPKQNNFWLVNKLVLVSSRIFWRIWLFILLILIQSEPVSENQASIFSYSLSIFVLSITHRLFMCQAFNQTFIAENYGLNLYRLG